MLLLRSAAGGQDLLGQVVWCSAAMLASINKLCLALLKQPLTLNNPSDLAPTRTSVLVPLCFIAAVLN